jgi:type I restriction enzyme M protein
VILLPENLFYNTSAPGVVMIVNRAKHHPGEMLLINASKQFEKGRPKNHLTHDHIVAISTAYEAWEEQEELAVVITTDEALRNDYNLSPSRYAHVDGDEEILPLEDAVVLLQEAEEERTAADHQLVQVLRDLGLTAHVEY